MPVQQHARPTPCGYGEAVAASASRPVAALYPLARLSPLFEKHVHELTAVGGRRGLGAAHCHGQCQCEWFAMVRNNLSPPKVSSQWLETM
eukprot:349929-Chlamydomonas_euryale.AAC.9